MPVTIGAYLSNACHYRHIFVQCLSLSAYICPMPVTIGVYLSKSNQIKSNHAVSRRKFARAASRPCGHKGSNRNTDSRVSNHNQDLPLGRTADTLGPKSKQKPHDGTHATKKPIR